MVIQDSRHLANHAKICETLLVLLALAGDEAKATINPRMNYQYKHQRGCRDLDEYRAQV